MQNPGQFNVQLNNLSLEGIPRVLYVTNKWMKCEHAKHVLSNCYRPTSFLCIGLWCSL
jgi:hypothetical protein